MHETRVNDRPTRRLRLPSRPVRLSREELAASRAGILGCYPSPELYEPEEEDATVEKLRPSVAKKNVRTHAKVGV
jgi:hypothetical protein